MTGRIRIGHGYDVHAFGDGDGIVLGGVQIPHSKHCSHIQTAMLHCTRSVTPSLGFGLRRYWTPFPRR